MEKKKYSVVFVIDYTWSGHIPTYHKYICKALLELGYIVYSVTEQPKEVEDWLKQRINYNSNNILFFNINKNENNISAYPDLAPPATVKKQVLSIKQRIINAALSIPQIKKILKVHETWKRIQKRAEDIMPDILTRNDVFIFLPYLDFKLLAPYYTANLFKRAFVLPWSGIYFHPSFFRTHKGSAKASLNFLKAPSCRSIALLDEGLIQKINEIVKKPVVQFPDITNDELDKNNLAPIALEVKKAAAGRKIISLMGVINNKKNVLTLLEVVRLSSKQNLPFMFLIAGENNKHYWDSEDNYKKVCAAIKEYPDNTFWHLQSLKDGHEYNSLIEISDVIMASYKNFYHSSNTLTKAALFKKPLIVSKGYLMEERVAKYNMGIAINENDPEMFLSAIKHLANNTDLNGKPLMPQYNAYYNQHTYSRLKQALVEMVI